MFKLTEMKIKTAFAISFASILIFCALIIGSILSYRMVSKYLIEKDYQLCIKDREEADKIAFSYFPIIKTVNIGGHSNVNIQGKIVNPNVENIELNFQTPDDGEMNKNVKFDKATGNFQIYASPSEKNIDKYKNYGVVFYLKLIPTNMDLACSKSTKSNSYSFDPYGCGLKPLLHINPGENICIEKGIDIGLGSAQAIDLIEEELKSLGLNIQNVDRCGFHFDNMPYRGAKCKKASSGILELYFKYFRN